MLDFSIIAQDPNTRSIVQQGLLERAFHDNLFPRLLYRAEYVDQDFGGNLGDSRIFTAAGMIEPNLAPLQPGVDPTPASYNFEQWETQLQQYGGTLDTYMPSNYAAIASILLRNAQQLGLSAGMTMNRLARDTAFNAAMAGSTVADGAQNSINNGSTLRVARLNGFTTARNPGLAGASQTRYASVSSSNPLSIKFRNSLGALVAAKVTAYTPDNAGDQFGPGTITLAGISGGPYNVADRAAVLADDRTDYVQAGGGDTIDSLTPNSIVNPNDIRAVVAKLRTMNVPTNANGYYHCHIDPVGEAQVFSNPEVQRMLTAMPDYYMYKEFGIGTYLGTVFIRNNESPVASTVAGGTTASYSMEEQFGGELFTGGVATGTPVHRALFVGGGGLVEYYTDLGALITEAGVTGKTGNFQITNNGISVNTDRVQLLIRAPLNRMQDQVATSWKFIGSWVARTDGAAGLPPRYKRLMTLNYGA